MFKSTIFDTTSLDLTFSSIWHHAQMMLSIAFYPNTYKSETFDEQVPWERQKTIKSPKIQIFITQSNLILGQRFFQNIISYSYNALYCLLQSCKEIGNFLWAIPKKMSKTHYFWHLITLNPRIKIFFQSSIRVTFFPLVTHNFMQNFRKI